MTTRLVTIGHPFSWLGRLWDTALLNSGGFLVAVVIAWIVELIFSLASSSSIRIGIANFCVLWFVSGAAFFVGTISGVLFGLPRAQIESARSLEDGNSSRYRPNTNFEDVSDWLT